MNTSLNPEAQLLGTQQLSDSLLSLRDARDTILARYHYIWSLSKDALLQNDWEVYGQLAGELNGLAFALGATNHKGKLPR